MKFEPGKVLKRDGLGNVIAFSYDPQWRPYGVFFKDKTFWCRSYQAASRKLNQLKKGGAS